MLKIFNDLSGEKEEFYSLEKDKVKMYVCGPTVYDKPHLGHARVYVLFDVIYRYLKFKGYDVLYIQNITDIDDKIINRALEENITIFQLSDKYTDLYFQDMKELNALSANFYPRATQHITQMIETIENLIEKGNAYESNGNVYFSVNTFGDYGKLSKRSLDELIDTEDSPDKHNPKDFALWKSRKENEPYWNSPWGPGRPGWHIECSVMSQKYLGNTIDIHGGGQDLIFPHHENEIAQSEVYTGEKFVNFWIHNAFVTINQVKMSKSLGNFYTIQQILQKYTPETLRYFLISTHYRKPIDFDEENLNLAGRSLEKFYIALEFSRDAQLEANNDFSDTVSNQLEEIIQQTEKNFMEAMDDDFNTALALTHLQSFIREVNKISSTNEVIAPETLKKAHNLLLNLGDILGLYSKNKEDSSNVLVNLILKIRQKARKNKNYELSDEIRDELNKLGIEIKDLPQKTIWYKKM